MAYSNYFDNDSILLVGRDGNGKTSCKKSIENVSNELKVVDFSGLGDTGRDRLHDLETVRDNLRTIMENYDPRGGFKAIVFVLKYGVRFTQQEKDAVADVKAMLGEDVFKNHGIIIFSYGGIFNSLDFMSWCRGQTGEIRNLFSEVNSRIVLFNNKAETLGQQTNKAETPGQQRKQFDELRSLVNGMGKSYGLSEFDNVQKYRQTPVNITPFEYKSNNLNSSSKKGNAYKVFWLCLLIVVVFGLCFIFGVIKLITWLIVTSVFMLSLATGTIILLRLRNCIHFEGLKFSENIIV